MKLESHLPKQSPWLYITPLLNAILLLVVYFLFSSGFIVQSGIRVEKPRSSSRCWDSGMGTIQSAASSAGSTQGVLRIMRAKLRAQAISAWNLKSRTMCAQG
jgi:hypothetical protein